MSSAYRDNASNYDVWILNNFNPKLQTESAIKNKLINLLLNLRRFEFVTTLVLELKKLVLQLY